MRVNLDAWIRCPPLPTGRRLHALRAIRILLARRDFKPLEGLIADAIDHDVRTLELEREWTQLSDDAHVSQTRPPLAEVDEQLDDALDALHDVLQRLLRGDSRNDPRIDDAYILLDVVFPAGACSITSLPYIDQMGAVDTLLEELNGALKEHVDACGVAHLVEEISRLGEHYRSELANLSPEELVLEQLLNAREEGVNFLHQIIALIIGRHFRPTHEDIAARAALLGPLDPHLEAFAAAAEAKLPCPDVA